MATTELIELAIETSKKAYVPYSHFPIGAVLVAKDVDQLWRTYSDF